ncbi:MAG: hypothetical protein ACRC9H_15180 [Aeromonas veronii]
MSQSYDDERMEFALQTWAEVEPESFDMTAEFAEHVLPLAQDLALLCEEMGIPCNLAFVLSRLDGVTTHNNTLIGGRLTRVSPELLGASQLVQNGPEGFFQVFRHAVQREKNFELDDMSPEGQPDGLTH